MKDFLDNPEIKSLVKAVEEIAKSGKHFSDIHDDEGNQYVDLVQEGGGVLGVALVGYTYMLEKAGIRFFSLAGTSAGAINTMIIAGLGTVDQPKSEKILDILGRKNLFDLVDGPNAVKKLIRKAIRGESGVGLVVALNIGVLYHSVTRRLGLNPGKNFENWITDELASVGIKTMSDIKRLRSKLPKGLKHTGGGSVEGLEPKLAIIAADITTHSKIEFPRMSELFFADPDSQTPAKLVRTSMSIPIFFEPVTFKDIPNNGKINDPRWYEHCRYSGPVPADVSFVDGGLLSNFPINVFHRSDGGVPRMPTFGVRLSTYREEFTEIKGLKNMLGAMISSMRQIHDYDFLLRNPDYSQLICPINADREFNWLNFDVSRADQVKMFVHGARAAVNFLNQFHWEKYKETRAQLAQVKKNQ